MKRWFIVVLFLLVACGGSASPAIEVNDVWGRPSPQMAENGAFYMTIQNNGGEEDYLTQASTEACAEVQLHETVMDANNVMNMNQVDQIAVPAGQSVTLAVGGLHVMCMGRLADFNPGDTIALTLHFTNAGDVAVEATIREP